MSGTLFFWLWKVLRLVIAIQRPRVIVNNMDIRETNTNQHEELRHAVRQ